MKIEDFLTQIDATLEMIRTTHNVSDKERARGQLKDLYNEFKEFEKQNEEKEPGSKANNILLNLKLIFNMFDCSRLLYKKKEFTSYNIKDIQGWLVEATELLKQLRTSYEDSKSESLRKNYAIFNMKNITQHAIISVCQYLPVSKGRTSSQKTGFFSIYCERFIELNNFISSLETSLINDDALKPIIIDCLDALFKTCLKKEYRDPFIEMDDYQKKLYKRANEHQIYIDKWDALIISLQQVSVKTGYVIPKFVRHPAATLDSLSNSKKRKKSPTSLKNLQPPSKLMIPPPLRFDLTVEPSDSPNSSNSLSSSSFLQSPGSSISKISSRSSSLILSPTKSTLASNTKNPKVLSKSPLFGNSPPPIQPVSPVRLGKSNSASSPLSSSSSSSGFLPVSPLRIGKSPATSSLSSSSSSSSALLTSPLRPVKSPGLISPLGTSSSSLSSPFPVSSNPSSSFSSSFAQVQQIFQGLENNEKKLTEELHTALRDKEQKEKEIKNMSQAKNNIQTRLDLSLKEILAAKRSLHESTQKVKQLTAELSQDKENIKKNEKTIIDLNIKITELDKVYKTSENKVASLQGQLAQALKQTQKLEQELEKEGNKILLLTKKVEEETRKTKTEHLKLQNTIDDLKKDKETITTKSQTLESKAASLQEQLTELQKTIETIDFRLTEKQLLEKDYLKKIATLEKQLKSAEEKFSEQSDALHKSQQEAKDQLEQAKTEFKGVLNCAARRYNKKDDALKKQREENHRLKENLKNSTEDHEKQIDELKKQLTDLAQESKESKYKLDKEEAATREFHQENTNIREENDQLRKEIAQTTQRYNYMSKLFSDERARNTTLRKAVEEYERGSKSSSSSSRNSDGGYRPHIFKLPPNTKTENSSSSSNSQTLNKGNGS